MNIAYLTGSRDYHRARSVDPSAGVLLTHAERVLACGNVDAQSPCKLAASLYSPVKPRSFTFYAAGPHPVGRQRHRFEAFLHTGAADVGQRFGYRKHRTGFRRNQSRLGGMTYGSGDAAFAVIVESRHAAIAERQLKLANTLLTGYAACYRAVNLVGEPVFAGNSLKLQHIAQVILNQSLVVADGGVLVIYLLVVDNSLGRRAEHIRHGQINGLAAVFLTEDEAGVVGGFAHHIEGSLLAFGYLTHLLNIFVAEHQTHAFLTLIADNLLCRKRNIAYRQSVDIDLAARGLNQLRERVEVSAGAMVMDAHTGIAFHLSQSAHHIADTFLHLRIGTLHRIQLYGIGILACGNRRYGAPAHAYAVIVAAHHHDAHVGFRHLFNGIVSLGVANAAGKHYHLVVS